MRDQSSSGAGCALHPEAAALSVCDRCGAYMCQPCSEGGTARLCPTCRARTGAAAFPLRRDAWSLDALFGIAWRAFTRGGLQIVVAFLILEGIYMALAFVPQALLTGLVRDPRVVGVVMLATTLLDLVVVMGLVLGLLDMTFDALDGQPVRIETVFWQFGKLGRILLLFLAVAAVGILPFAAFEGLVILTIYLGSHAHTAPAVAAGVASVAALVGSTWLLLAVSLAPMEIAIDDDVGPLEALKRAFALARGKRWNILGVGLLAWLTGMAGMLLCGIGMLASVPFSYLVMSALFLTLRNGSGLPEPVRRGNRIRDAVTPVPVPPPPAGG